MPMTYEDMLDESVPTVLREADALYEGRGRLHRTCEGLSSRLDAIGVVHSLVGGFAVFLHGLRRFTEDIDMLVTPAGLSRLRDELIGRGYVVVPGSTRSIRDAETGVRIDFVVSGEYPCPEHVERAGDGRPKPVAFPEPSQGRETHEGLVVVDLRTLIEMKLASGMTAPGRLQDLADAQRLIQIHALGADFAERLHPYVRAKFEELVESVRAAG